MSLKDKFPPLYQCEKCGSSVSVKPQGDGVEPIIKRSCNCPENTVVLAKRKVTLRGVGEMNVIKQKQIKITMTLRQFLCAITGRSI